MPDRMFGHDCFRDTFQINSGVTGTSVVDDLTVGGAATVAETLTVTGVLTASSGVVGAITGAATQVTVADESSDTTCFPLYVTAATGDLAPKSGSNLTFNSSTGDLGATSFTGNLVGNVTGNVTGDVGGAAMAVGEGSGVAGAAAISSEITKEGKVITTHIFIDIAGLVVSTTLNDIIGDSAAANAHFGQVQLSESGQIFSGTVTCLEAPTTGVADIDFNAASVSTGTENEDVTALADYIALLSKGGSWALNDVTALTDLPDATSDYLYLSAGAAGTPGTYGAGQFLIELKGYEA